MSSRVSDRDRDRAWERVVARIARAARNGVRVALLSFSNVEGPPSGLDMLEAGVTGHRKTRLGGVRKVGRHLYRSSCAQLTLT